MKAELMDVPLHDALDKTLNIMYKFEKVSLSDNYFINFCIETFGKIYNERIINNNNIPSFLKYIQSWVNKNLTYQDDEYDETIISPRHIIKQNYLFGDCDDFSLLIKTILSFFNIKSEYILFSQTWGNFTHIAVVVDLNNKYYYLDGVRNDFNRLPQNYKYYKIIG